MPVANKDGCTFPHYHNVSCYVQPNDRRTLAALNMVILMTSIARMLPKYAAESRSSTAITLGVLYSVTATWIDLTTANVQSVH